jgi:hypothetical protein
LPGEAVSDTSLFSLGSSRPALTGSYVNILGREPMAYEAFEHGETNGRSSGTSDGGLSPSVFGARPGVS